MRREASTRRAPGARIAFGDSPPWHGPLVAELALVTRATPFSAPGWLFELKFDGFRLLAAKDGRTVTLRYRSGRDATSVYPEIVEGVAALPCRRALLDGELVVFGSDGRSDFELLRKRAITTVAARTRPRATACFFDLLALDGRDLRQLPLESRKGALRALIEREKRLMYVEHLKDRGEQLLAGVRRLGLEGIVAKRAGSRYLAGRTGAWLKIKVEETADFVVVGIAEPSEGTFWRPGLVLAAVGRGGLRYVGRVAVGATELAELDAIVSQRGRSSAPCAGAGPAAVWLQPAVACEVRFLSSSRRVLRHAVFIRFRPDKRWDECDLAD